MLVEDAILGRRSVKVFDSRPVPREAIERCLLLATLAPNHKLTEPWRFTVVMGEARTKLSDQVYQDLKAIDSCLSSTQLEASMLKYHRQIHSAPVIIVTYALGDDNPIRSQENYAATAAAIENMLLTAYSIGLGAIWRTGSIFEGDHVRNFLRSPAHSQFVGAIYLGYSAGRDVPRRRTDASKLTYWVPMNGETQI